MEVAPVAQRFPDVADRVRRLGGVGGPELAPARGVQAEDRGLAGRPQPRAPRPAVPRASRRAGRRGSATSGSAAGPRGSGPADAPASSRSRRAISWRIRCTALRGSSTAAASSRTPHSSWRRNAFTTSAQRAIGDGAPRVDGPERARATIPDTVSPIRDARPIIRDAHVTQQTRTMAVKSARRDPSRTASPGADPSIVPLLEEIQDRVLWLAIRMIHEANVVRPNTDGLKVGGHQASCAIVITILTELYFRWLRRGDLVAVKPHASPAFHAIQYLMGNLDAELPDPAARVRRPPVVPQPHEGPRPGRLLDGLGRSWARSRRCSRAWPTATSATTSRAGRQVAGSPLRRARRRRRARRGQRLGGRDRGRPRRPRQRHDDRGPEPPEPRPGGAGHPDPPARAPVPRRRLAGPRGEVRPPPPAAVRRPGGEALRRRIDDMSNEEYQVDDPAARARGPRAPDRPAPEADRDDLRRAVADVPDDDLPRCSPTSAATTSTRSRPRSTRPTPTGAGRRRLRLHDQGLAPAVRGRLAQPLGARLAPSRCSSSRRGSAPTPTTRGRRCRPTRRPTGSPAPGARSCSARAPEPTSPTSPDARRPARAEVDVRIAAKASTQVVFGDTLATLARVAGRRIADRDGVAGRLRLDEPRRLDQPRRRLRRRTSSPVRRGAAAPALAAQALGPAHRARHQRDEPVHVAGPVRAHRGAVRRAADPDRHGLRPVHRPRPRRADLRALREEPRSSSPRRRPGRRSRPRAARTSRPSRRRSASSCRTCTPTSRRSARRSSGRCSRAPAAASTGGTASRRTCG